MQNYSDSLSLWNNLTEITALCSGLWRCRLAAVACYPACKYILWSGSVRVLWTGHQEPQSICLSKRKRILFHFPLAIRVWKSCCPTRQKCGLTDSFCQVLPSQHQSIPARPGLVQGFRDRNSTVYSLIWKLTLMMLGSEALCGAPWLLHSIFHSNILLTCGLRGSKPMYSSLGMMDEITCGRKETTT